jgi:hypothetical protein
MYVKTGTYVGDSTGSHAITGVGFRPRVVVLRRDGGSFHSSWIRISTMPANNSRSFTGANALRSDFAIKSLDADGFTVGGSDSEINQSGTTYFYLAVGGEGADFAYGTYTGNGADNRDITIGGSFSGTPDMVWVFPEAAQNPAWRSSDFSGDNALNFEDDQTANLIQSFGSGTFQVGTNASVNSNTAVYHWVAFKAQALVFKTLTYTGNGSDNRSITGAGFQPTYAVTERRDAFSSPAVVRHASVHSGDESIPVNGSTSGDVTNNIQAFVSDGFEVGTDNRVNSNSHVYYAFVFKDRAPATVYQPYRSLTRSLDPGDWDGTVTAYLEVHGFTDDSGNPLLARLYNVTDASAVSGSEISSAAVSNTRARSSSFSLASGSKVYRVEYGGLEGGSFNLEDAVLIVDVT